MYQNTFPKSKPNMVTPEWSISDVRQKNTPNEI